MLDRACFSQGLKLSILVMSVETDFRFKMIACFKLRAYDEACFAHIQA